MDTLIASLQRILTEKGMTPADFAQFVPCSKDEVWNWLKGRNKPNPASREGIARALKKIRGLPDIQPFEEMARDLAIYKSIKRRLTVADKL